MNTPERLMLKIGSEFLPLMQQLLIEAKAALGPLKISKPGKKKTLRREIDRNYLNALSVIRAIMASKTLFEALPKPISEQRAVIYLSADELQTIVNLLRKRVRAQKDKGNPWRALLQILLLAQNVFKTTFERKPTSAIKISAQEVQETIKIARSGTISEVIQAFDRLGALRCLDAFEVLSARAFDPNPKIRLACVNNSLEILGTGVINYLKDYLKDKVIQIGMTAAARLAEMGTEQSARVLLEAAASEDIMINTHGLYGLMYWESQYGTEAFLEAASNPAYRPRGDAALALGRSNNTAALPELHKIFERERDVKEKLSMAAALCMLGEDQSQVICDALDSPTPHIKVSALECIREMNDKSYFTDILPLLKDKDATVAEDANHTLEVLGLTQKEKKLLTRNEQARIDIRKSLPDGYQLDVEE